MELNYYWILQLSLDPPVTDVTQINIAIDKKQSQWMRSIATPEEEYYRTQITNMRKAFLDSEKRISIINEAVQRGKEELEELLEVLNGMESVSEDKIQRVLDSLHGRFRLETIRRRIQVSIKEQPAPVETYSGSKFTPPLQPLEERSIERPSPEYLEKLRILLPLLEKRDLYELLGYRHNAVTETLKERTARQYQEILNKKTDIQRIALEIIGIAQTIFKSEKTRKGYDQSLREDFCHRLEVRFELRIDRRKVKGRPAEKTITRKNYDDSIEEAIRIGRMDRVHAEWFVYDYFGQRMKVTIPPSIPGKKANSMPRQSAPTNSMPRQSAPTNSMPRQSTPTNSMPRQSTPTSSTPRQSTPTSFTPHQSAPSSGNRRSSSSSSPSSSSRSTPQNVSTRTPISLPKKLLEELTQKSYLAVIIGIPLIIVVVLLLAAVVLIPLGAILYYWRFLLAWAVGILGIVGVISLLSDTKKQSTDKDAAGCGAIIIVLLLICLCPLIAGPTKPSYWTWLRQRLPWADSKSETQTSSSQSDSKPQTKSGSHTPNASVTSESKNAESTTSPYTTGRPSATSGTSSSDSDKSTTSPYTTGRPSATSGTSSSDSDKSTTSPYTTGRPSAASGASSSDSDKSTTSPAQANEPQTSVGSSTWNTHRRTYGNFMSIPKATIEPDTSPVSPPRATSDDSATRRETSVSVSTDSNSQGKNSTSQRDYFASSTESKNATKEHLNSQNTPSEPIAISADSDLLGQIYDLLYPNCHDTIEGKLVAAYHGTWFPKGAENDPNKGEAIGLLLEQVDPQNKTVKGCLFRVSAPNHREKFTGKINPAKEKWPIRLTLQPADPQPSQNRSKQEDKRNERLVLESPLITPMTQGNREIAIQITETDLRGQTRRGETFILTRLPSQIYTQGIHAWRQQNR